MIAIHTSVTEAEGISGEMWDLKSVGGKGEKKAKSNPLHLKGTMFLALSLSPPLLFFPPFLHMH